MYSTTYHSQLWDFWYPVANHIRNQIFKSNFPICMLAQNYFTLLDQTRSACRLSIAHELSAWGLWVRTSSKVFCSPHCLWIYDFPRFSKIHWKPSKLYPFRQLPCTPPKEFWVAEASWKCIFLNAHHQCPGETRDEGKGQQVAGENSMGLSFRVLVSLCCVLAVEWEGGWTQDLVPPLVPRILKLIWKMGFKALCLGNLRNLR